mmetsp:Transcript_116763/g.183614  ORF Transcript_116763/g.183614 Transcript_116763/m.183614 type:complete len:85 (+) Transcript_116763:843-1097(+)
MGLCFFLDAAALECSKRKNYFVSFAAFVSCLGCLTRMIPCSCPGLSETLCSCVLAKHVLQLDCVEDCSRMDQFMQVKPLSTWMP